MTTAVDAVGGAGLNQINTAGERCNHFLVYLILSHLLNVILNKICLASFSAQDIVLSFANLNFITDRLGSASGFQAYQNTLSAAVTFLRTDTQVSVLNEMMRSAFREYCKLPS